MTARKLAYCCLTGVLMWLCLIGGAWLATAHAEHQPEPVRTQAPAGEQFNEGPALVRLPVALPVTDRFIF